MITMQEMEPMAVCMVTQQMFDRKFRSNFADNMLLRDRDSSLEPLLLRIKREMNSGMTEAKYLQGHKMNIVGNIDRIMALSLRFTSIDLRKVEELVKSGKDIMRKVINADSFEEIASMEGDFKSQIMLPMYELNIAKSKRG